MPTLQSYNTRSAKQRWTNVNVKPIVVGATENAIFKKSSLPPLFYNYGIWNKKNTFRWLDIKFLKNINLDSLPHSFSAWPQSQGYRPKEASYSYNIMPQQQTHQWNVPLGFLWVWRLVHLIFPFIFIFFMHWIHINTFLEHHMLPQHYLKC